MNVPSTIENKIHKGLHSGIIDLINRDYQFIAGDKIHNMLADDIIGLVEKCYKDPWKMVVGQVLWYGAKKDEKPHYGRSAGKMTFTPVVLTLVSKEDLDLKANGFSNKEIRKKKVIRLFQEAYNQGSLLTHADIAFLLHASTGTIGKDVREYMEETKTIVPSRGVIHDIGRTMTHKRIIVRLFLEGYQTPDIARRTSHTEEACDRYIKAFKKVRKLSKTMNPQEIANTLEMGLSLVKEYLEILKDYDDNSR